MLALTRTFSVTVGVEFVLALDEILKSSFGVESVLLRTSLGTSNEVTATQSLRIESVLWGHLDGLSVLVESLFWGNLNGLLLGMIWFNETSKVVSLEDWWGVISMDWDWVLDSNGVFYQLVLGYMGIFQFS